MHARGPTMRAASATPRAGAAGLVTRVLRPDGERAAGREAALQLRRPARFEAALSAPELLVEDVEVEAAPSRPPAVRRGRCAACAATAPAPSVPGGAAPVPAVARAARAARRPEPRAAALQRRRWRRRRDPAPPPARRRSDGPCAAAPTPPAERAGTRAARGQPACRRGAAGSSAGCPPAPRATARPSPPPQRRRRAARGGARPPPAPVPDLAVLLREHVVPALVDRGVVSRDERAVVAGRPAAPAPRRAPPRPGHRAVRATPPAAPAPSSPAEPPARRSEPDVHLHIDRVVVTRAPAPAPPQPPAPPPRPPDRRPRRLPRPPPGAAVSNSLAIAAVTSTLRYVLDRPLQQPHAGPVGGASVTTLRPAELPRSRPRRHAGDQRLLLPGDPEPRLEPDRPADPPRATASLVQRPVAALDLHYLLTCYGDEPPLEPQRLLGRVVGALAATSVLTRDVVAAALDALRRRDRHRVPRRVGSRRRGRAGEARADDAVARGDVEALGRPRHALPALAHVPRDRRADRRRRHAARRLPVRAARRSPSRRRAAAARRAGDRPAGGARRRRVGARAARQPACSARCGGPDRARDRSPATATDGRRAARGPLDDSVPAGVHAVQVRHRSAAGPGGLPPARVVAARTRSRSLVRPAVTVGDVDRRRGHADRDSAAARRPARHGRARPARRRRSRRCRARAAAGRRSRRAAGVAVLPRDEIPDGRWLCACRSTASTACPSSSGRPTARPTC